VLLLGHSDTVFPHGTAAKRPTTINGDVINGPGGKYRVHRFATSLEDPPRPTYFLVLDGASPPPFMLAREAQTGRDG